MSLMKIKILMLSAKTAPTAETARYPHKSVFCPSPSLIITFDR